MVCRFKGGLTTPQHQCSSLVQLWHVSLCVVLVLREQSYAVLLNTHCVILFVLYLVWLSTLFFEKLLPIFRTADCCEVSLVEFTVIIQRTYHIFYLQAKNPPKKSAKLRLVYRKTLKATLHVNLCVLSSWSDNYSMSVTPKTNSWENISSLWRNCGDLACYIFTASLQGGVSALPSIGAHLYCVLCKQVFGLRRSSPCAIWSL